MPQDTISTFRPPSPFHVGEQEIQTRLGMRTPMEQVGQKVIRDHMPDQHREFFASLPFLIVGTTDQRDRLWASILLGEPGFVQSPTPHQLAVRTRPIFWTSLIVGASPALWA